MSVELTFDTMLNLRFFFFCTLPIALIEEIGNHKNEIYASLSESLERPDMLTGAREFIVRGRRFQVYFASDRHQIDFSSDVRPLQYQGDSLAYGGKRYISQPLGNAQVSGKFRQRGVRPDRDMAHVETICVSTADDGLSGPHLAPSFSCRERRTGQRIRNLDGQGKAADMASGLSFLFWAFLLQAIGLLIDLQQ